jgi:hypothetical protein
LPAKPAVHVQQGVLCSHDQDVTGATTMPWVLAQHLVPQGVFGEGGQLQLLNCNPAASVLQACRREQLESALLLAVDEPDAHTVVQPLLSAWLQAPGGTLPGSRLHEKLGAFKASLGALTALGDAAERRAKESDTEESEAEGCWSESDADAPWSESEDARLAEHDDEGDAEGKEHYSDGSAYEPGEDDHTKEGRTSALRRAHARDESNEDTQSDSSFNQSA